MQFANVLKNMRNDRTGLYYHAYDNLKQVFVDLIDAMLQYQDESVVKDDAKGVGSFLLAYTEMHPGMYKNIFGQQRRS